MIDMVWKGVIIEESLEDASLLVSVSLVGYDESFLEEEEGKGVMRFHHFELADEKKEWFVREAERCLKHGWYIHIGKSDVLVVIFKERFFEFSSLEKEKLEEARKYGLSVGVIREQMPFEELSKDPFY